MSTTTVADARTRRTELAAFLRSRRERITPEDAGLPPGLRRRTAGLRREEVAQLSGVGVTWYTWLEQGRPINASTQVLDAVARTLRLDQPEREHLYRLADCPASPPAPAPDGWSPPADPADPRRADHLAGHRPQRALRRAGLERGLRRALPHRGQRPGAGPQHALAELHPAGVLPPVPEPRRPARPDGRPVARRLRAPRRGASLDRVRPAAAGGQPRVRADVGPARGGQPGELPQDLPAPGVRPADHDDQLAGGARRAGDPDGRLHPGGRADRQRPGQAHRRRRRQGQLPLLA